MTFRVLGPLTAEDERGPVDLKGPRHRAVLARLLVARSRVVPVDTIVADLWEDPPVGAVGAVQTFVAALRRALEPDRPPRTPARLLVTSGPGYVLRAEVVDAWQFEAAVSGTLGQVDAALALWRGPAYAEFADQPWARGEIARLDELRLLAVERRAAALLDAGHAAAAVPDLEEHVGGHPWREEAWRLLALAHYRAGRQGDALATLRRARRKLADELGIDPGPGLRQLEADVLAQAPAPAPAPVATTLVGRSEELARLAAAAGRDRTALALVAGEAGAGKTALAEAFAAHLAARGWRTAWGTSPDDEGAPAAWPWTTVLDGLPGTAPEPDPVRARWHRAVAGYLGAQAPLLVVLDDLHWADEETLALLASLVLEPLPHRVLVLATHRTTDVPPRLRDLLGRVARAEPARVYLTGLPAPAIRELVRATTGRDVDAATAAAIHRRSGGNPFFVRELARLLDTGDLSDVPAGVRDVVRHRVATLPEPVQDVLRQASVQGVDVELELLPGDVLDALETAAQHGFLGEQGPGRFRFVHGLVRDTVYADVSTSRRARWHAAVAAALAERRRDEPAALAHHFLLAGNSSAAARYARAAAAEAERRFAPHQAARWWRVARDLGPPDDHVTAGLARTLAVTGGLAEARALRAELLGSAPALVAFDVPAIWTQHDDPVLARRIADAAERALADGPPPALRSRLLATIAVELRNTGDERARAAAREAEVIARGLGDPAVLAFALNARFMQSFDRAGMAPERAAFGAELAALPGLVPFEVLGHLILVQSGAALADLAAADRHAAAADALGAEHDIPLVGVFTDWYRAMRRSITGAPAEAAYRAAAARLGGTGMSGVDNGILGLALLCDRLQRGLPPVDGDFGAHEPWCRPLVEGSAAVIPPAPRDLLFEVRTCLHAITAVVRDDRATMARLYEDLLPAADELAGAGSGMVTLRPVAHYLGDLAVALGCDAEAHRAHADEIAARAGATHWLTRTGRRRGRTS
ncbi:BTAD domain-containing putative transcriptional regulator [Actinophytocola glycyrrhizae]|uniref:BTAD domain-containing putative transcriptional regulator n=1 Tax=Actinophytocola glycyrrhizae TaxID=2044873 RepID=A0ABV9RTN8_9PSEU